MRLDEYLDAGDPMVWIGSPERRTIRIFRNNGTTKLFRADAIIENEPLLPGFRLPVSEVFPATESTAV
jgi:Uma2 family endonuclease